MPPRNDDALIAHTQVEKDLSADIAKADSKLTRAVHESTTEAERAKAAAKNESFPSASTVKRDVNDLVSKKPLKEHQKKNLLKAGGALLAAVAGVVVVIAGGTAIVKKVRHDDPDAEVRARSWFGRRQSEAGNVAHDVKHKVGKAGESLGDKLSGARKTAGSKLEDAGAASREAAEKLKKEAQKGRDKVEVSGAKASDKSDNIVQKAAHSVTSGAKSAGHTVSGAASGAVHKTKGAAGTVGDKGGDFFGDIKGWFGARKDEFIDSAHKGKKAQRNVVGH